MTARSRTTDWHARAAAVLLLVTVAAPASAAKRIWDPSKPAVAKALKRAYTQKNVSDALTEGVDHRAMAKLLVAASHAPGARTRKRLGYDIDNAVNRMLATVEPKPAAAKEFLREMDTLYNWAARADLASGGTTQHMADLGAHVLRFAAPRKQDSGNWVGAWFELRLAAREARGRRLNQLQPRAPLSASASEPFRDAELLLDPVGPLRAWLEAKNWQRRSVRHGVSSLKAQVATHFRHVDAGSIGPPHPPGLKLIFEFNSRMPRQWEEAIRSATVTALRCQQPPRSCADAWQWVTDHLEVRCVDLGRLDSARPGGCEQPVPPPRRRCGRRLKCP